MVTLTLDDDIDADRFDIKESFEALDGQKTGRLGVDLAYTLLLGLGYMADYKKKDDFTPATLKETAKRIEISENGSYNKDDFRCGIKLETLLTIVATVRAFINRVNDDNNYQMLTILILCLFYTRHCSILLYLKGIVPEILPRRDSN